MKNTTVSSTLIENFLPNPPDGYDYEVKQFNTRYWAIYLIHPDYDYKHGVKTIHSFVSSKGEVHAPLHGKPSNKVCCELTQLFKQPCYTTIKPLYTQLKSK